MNSTATSHLADATFAFPRGATRPALFAGQVDFLALEPGREIVSQHFRHDTELMAPGIQVRLDSRRVTWHATSTSLLILVGRPRSRGAPATVEQVLELLS